jgi:transposase
VAEVVAPAPQPATSASGLICIELPGGVRVSVDGLVDVGALARVLSVLR